MGLGRVSSGASVCRAVGARRLSSWGVEPSWEEDRALSCVATHPAATSMVEEAALLLTPGGALVLFGAVLCTASLSAPVVIFGPSVSRSAARGSAAFRFCSVNHQPAAAPEAGKESAEQRTERETDATDGQS